MDKKNIFRLIAIILIVVGIFSIAFAFLDTKEDKTNNNNNNGGIVVEPITPDDEIQHEPLSYDDAYNMAVSLYGDDNVNIELEEEADRFVIKRTYKESGNIERYYIDKETGVISSENIIVEALPVG